MNSFELNKIFGAILGTLVFVMGLGFLAEAIYRPIENRGAGFTLAEPEETDGGTPAEVAQIDPIAVRMQTASVDAGQRLIARCQSCHDYSPANANRAGPGIYDVMGQPIAHHDDFAYSDALEALRAAGEIWDYENMDGFLESPRNFAPGTRMTFAGLSNPQDRADLIAFLRSLSDDPIPLPEAEEVPAAEEAPATDEDAGVDGAPVIEIEPVQPEPGDLPAEGVAPDPAAP